VVNHFLIVGKNSSDGTVDYLSAAADISVWQAGHSYKNLQLALIG